MTIDASIAVFGSLTIDDLVFPDGATRWAVPGGGAAYAAFGAALWTNKVSIVAPLGTDYPAGVFPEQVDLSRCRQIPHSLRNWGLYEENGRRHFVSRSHSRRWHDFCPDLDDVASGKQIAAHLSAMPPERALALVRELRRSGTHFISLDMDEHDLLGEMDRKIINELMANVDLFLPSLHDAQRLCGKTDPIDNLRYLRKIAPNISLIAIKCGANGVIAHASTATTLIHISAYPVTVIDETGAGDAFCGGVLASFANREDPTEALICGSVSASFCVEGVGLNGLTNVMEEVAPRTDYLRSTLRLGVIRHL